MSKRVWSGVLASIFCGTVAVAAAQDPSTAQSGAASGKSMTVSGCIQKAEPSAGATGTAGSTAASDTTKFVLKNVSSAGAGAAGTAGTAGTAGASAAGAMASEYRLDADDAKLSPHVGHKVEITGSVDKSASGAASTAATASPKLKVDSVKMVSATCP
jgi:hypothetical protein